VSRRRGAAALLGALAALAVPCLRGEAHAALTWDASVGAGVQWTDNLHFDPRTPIEEGRRQPVEELIFVGTPSVQLAWAEGRDRLQLAYAGEYQRFSGDEELDALWVHDLAGSLGWRRWDPFFLEVRERLDREARSQQRETEAVVDQIDHNVVTVRSGFWREYGTRGIVDIGYRGELDSYPGVDDADRVLRHSGEVLWRYRWTPIYQTELRASWGRVSRDLNADYTEGRVFLGVDQRISEQLSAAYGLELIRQDVVSGGVAGGQERGDRTALLKGASLSGGHERGGSWRLAYQEYLEGEPDGDTLERKRASAEATLNARLGSSWWTRGWYEARDYRDSGREEHAWGPMTTARWLLVPWLAGDLAASWTSTAVREADQPQVEDHTVRLAAGLVARVSARLTLEAGYCYRKNDSDDAARSYRGNLVFAYLTGHFRALQPRQLPASHVFALITSPDDEPGQTGGVGAGENGR
jgi:hypothetical protein